MNPRDAISALIAAGWTEAKIASAVGTSQATVNRIKHGARPNFDMGSAIVALAAQNAAESTDDEPRQAA